MNDAWRGAQNGDRKVQIVLEQAAERPLALRFRGVGQSAVGGANVYVEGDITLQTEARHDAFSATKFSKVDVTTPTKQAAGVKPAG